MFGRKKKTKKPATPIALDETAQYVGFWYRVGAALVDIALIAAMAVPIILVAAGGFEEPGPLHGIIVLTAAFVYSLGSCWWKSRTAGLWLISAKIVDIRSGEKPRWWRFIIRFFGVFLSLIPAGLGIFWIGWAARHRGWPDYLAKTVVIGDETLRPLTEEEKANLADTVDWSSQTSH
jgi:uncharacterized RDD family membrane protein YckC